MEFYQYDSRTFSGIQSTMIPALRLAFSHLLNTSVKVKLEDMPENFYYADEGDGNIVLVWGAGVSSAEPQGRIIITLEDTNNITPNRIRAFFGPRPWYIGYDRTIEVNKTFVLDYHNCLDKQGNLYRCSIGMGYWKLDVITDYSLYNIAENEVFYKENTGNNKIDSYYVNQSMFQTWAQNMGILYAKQYNSDASESLICDPTGKGVLWYKNNNILLFKMAHPYDKLKFKQSSYANRDWVFQSDSMGQIVLRHGGTPHGDGGYMLGLAEVNLAMTPFLCYRWQNTIISDINHAMIPVRMVEVPLKSDGTPDHNVRLQTGGDSMTNSDFYRRNLLSDDSSLYAWLNALGGMVSAPRFEIQHNGVQKMFRGYSLKDFRDKNQIYSGNYVYDDSIKTAALNKSWKFNFNNGQYYPIVLLDHWMDNAWGDVNLNYTSTTLEADFSTESHGRNQIYCIRDPDDIVVLYQQSAGAVRRASVPQTQRRDWPSSQGPWPGATLFMWYTTAPYYPAGTGATAGWFLGNAWQQQPYDRRVNTASFTYTTTVTARKLNLSDSGTISINNTTNRNTLSGEDISFGQPFNDFWTTKNIKGEEIWSGTYKNAQGKAWYDQWRDTYSSSVRIRIDADFTDRTISVSGGHTQYGTLKYTWDITYYVPEFLYNRYTATKTYVKDNTYNNHGKSPYVWSEQGSGRGVHPDKGAIAHIEWEKMYNWSKGVFPNAMYFVNNDISMEWDGPNHTCYVDSDINICMRSKDAYRSSESTEQYGYMIVVWKKMK